jgi:5-methylthioribose kinase
VRDTDTEPRYRELDISSVAAFAAPYLDGPATETQEVGDGNLNRVFRVYSATSSVVVKQALPYLKVAGEAWPLTRDRARIERDAVAEHAKLVPDLLPAVIHFDPALSAIVFEDLRGYTSWRELLISGVETPGVAGRVGRYSAGVLLGTSDLIQRSLERKQLRTRFSYSELCLVTEDLVFTAPYADAATNRYDESASDLVRTIQQDRALRMAVAELRFLFKTRDEALIHGDLHTGSVLVSEHDSRVIDLEFAFFGPFGFDPGNVLGNLALAYIGHDVQGHTAFADTIAEYAREYWQSFTEECARLWQPSEPWYNRFLSTVVCDAARFAGAEMIRRIVGLAHAKDIDSLQQPSRRAAQQRVLAGGRALVIGTACTSIDELWHRATQEESFA